MALRDISFFVTDDGLVSEDLVIGLPMLPLHRTDSKALLENNCSAVDGIDFAEVRYPTASHVGQIGRFMDASTMRVKGKPYEHGIEYCQRSAQPACDRHQGLYAKSRS